VTRRSVAIWHGLGPATAQPLLLRDGLSVIVHINHIAPSKKKATGQRSAQSELAGLVTGSMMSMVEEGVLDPKLAPSLRVHLDWIQYKTNFRDPVVVRRTADSWGKLLPLAEIAVDLRQAVTDRLPDDLVKAVQSLAKMISWFMV